MKNDKTEILSVGIDASLRGTGCVALAAGQAKIFTMQLASPAAAHADLEGRFARYCDLAYRIVNFVEEHKPQICCIESYAYSKSGTTAVMLAEFGGILRADLLGIAGVQTIEVGVNQVKLFACGKGNATKLDVATAVCRRTHLDFQSTDLYDAFSLAEIGGCLRGLTAKFEYQRRVIEALRQKDCIHGKKKGRSAEKNSSGRRGTKAAARSTAKR